MARKTFISYKYSESRDLRDRILDALREDAIYYQGETSDSPDMSDSKTETIKENLKNMIYGSSVTIVIVSPNMRKSKWIDWEISYSLKEVKRGDRTSHTNGVVCVIKNSGTPSNCDWIKSFLTGNDGCAYWAVRENYLYPIIHNNMFNRKNAEYFCEARGTVDDSTQSYMSLVDEDSFLADPNFWVENAFDKSKELEAFLLQKEIY